VEDVNISNSNALVEEVKINLNMHCVLMLDEVGGEVDCADIVAVDEGCP
jgi:hypothetical protein